MSMFIARLIPRRGRRPVTSSGLARRPRRTGDADKTSRGRRAVAGGVVLRLGSPRAFGRRERPWRDRFLPVFAPRSSLATSVHPAAAHQGLHPVRVQRPAHLSLVSHPSSSQRAGPPVPIPADRGRRPYRTADGRSGEPSVRTAPARPRAPVLAVRSGSPSAWGASRRVRARPTPPTRQAMTKTRRRS